MDISHIRMMRRVVQLGFVALFLFAPVFDLLRYDVAAKDFYFLGQVRDLGLGQDFYQSPDLIGPGQVALRFFVRGILPWLVVLAVFPLLGFFLGRAFCGWACPEGALFEFADYLTLKCLGRRSVYGPASNDPPGVRGNRWLWGLIAAAYLMTVPPFFGIMLSGYFIAPARIWNEITTMNLSPGLRYGIFGVSLYMLVTFVLVRHVICKYVCSGGLMQMLFGWISPLALVIRFKGHEGCTDCRGCEQACFMGVRPRSARKNINCVNCGACIEACRRELGHDHGLFSFRFGKK